MRLPVSAAEEKNEGCAGPAPSAVGPLRFSVREVAPAHTTTPTAPIKAGAKIVISFHVIPGTDQSESHSETDVLIHNDQRTQITQKVPTMRSAREAVSPQVRARLAISRFFLCFVS